MIGSGIAGLAAAYLLDAESDVTVFEAQRHVGGHTHTVAVRAGERDVAVDTGFIVYNERTYPEFCRLLCALGVETQPSDMSFSVCDDETGLEYKGDNLNTLFAQRRNLLNPRHYRMLWEIVRFYRVSRELLRGDAEDLTLGEYVRRRGFSADFVRRHLIPMGAAIWSADPERFDEFPAAYFVRFCKNHGMLNLLRRPQWRVIRGGSFRYVEKLTERLRRPVRTETPVRSIRRSSDGVEITSDRHGVERFDHVVIASHSDQALAMLADATATEREILGAIPYQPNDVVLHTDVSVLPRSPRARASWNYRLSATPGGRATLTYNMNLLQSLDTDETYCVSLNSDARIDPARVLGRYVMHHPVYTVAGVRAQQRRSEICGVGRTHFCGAYWGYGFHEDGLRSALDVAARFGRKLA